MSTREASTVSRADVISANAGDHALVHEMLLAIFQQPSREDFAATLDDPLYEPSDRLLIKRGGAIAAHLLMAKRSMHFGSVTLPTAELQWLATLPEYRGCGYARRLLQAADDQSRLDGAVLGIVQTSIPAFFESRGWVVGTQETYRRAGTHALRAHIEPQPGRRSGKRQLTTRMWRHVELRALIHIYELNTRETYGPNHRSEEYWQWLLSRKAYDQMIVAIEGDDTLEFGEQAPKIVGYAAVRGDRVVELLADPGHPGVSAQLLARACREAIERDVQSLRIFRHGGEDWEDELRDDLVQPDELGDVTMLKVLDPAEFLRRLYPELLERAKAADIDRPCSLQLLVDDRPLRWTLTRRSVKLESTKPTVADLQCTSAQFSQLLLGGIDLAAAAEAGELRVRNKTAAGLLTTIFPKLELWRPLLDNLRC